MDDGDGFDVLNFLRTHPDKCVVPVVVLSGSGDADDVRQAYVLGASGFLVKPHEPEELRSLLKKLYDFFSECEVPQVTDSGSPLPTSSGGKLGARFLTAA
jgi:CheY-like chemotaxis protein